jgi:hypothetical protein
VRIRDVVGVGSVWDGQVTGMYEVMCPVCGDDANLNYDKCPAEIQRIRGPYRSREEAKAGLMEHIGLRP